MARKENDKQLNIVIEDERREALKKYCSENGFSLNTAVNNAIELVLLSEAKETFPDQGASIDDFNLYMGKIISAYKTSLDRIATADERAESKVQAQLRGMETLTSVNAKMQQELETANNTIADLKGKLAKLNVEVETLRKFKSEYDSNVESVTATQKRCIELTQKMADMQIAHAEEIKKLQDENYAKILEIVKTVKQ